ncbi:MAG TPA: sigma-70 family RNA polymerase sigma factor [Verrucomicrobiae bacterium]|nr:sigma-70 family RNA polymerase sigma factor [Verrucomicrobiae bacterium]
MMPSAKPSPEQLALVQGLFIQNLPALKGFVLALGGSFDLVDDVIQETFIVVGAKAAEFKPGTNFRAWAFTIAKFKLLQALESSHRNSEARLSPDVLDALCAEESNDDWMFEQQLRLLSSCTKQLAPKAYEMIELRYQHSKRPAEIAQLVGWTVDAVHVALSRARDFLRDCVKRRMNAETS